MKCASNILKAVTSISSLKTEQEHFQDPEVIIKPFSNSLRVLLVEWLTENLGLLQSSINVSVHSESILEPKRV
jgi:hypothetical protein